VVTSYSAAIDAKREQIVLQDLWLQVCRLWPVMRLICFSAISFRWHRASAELVLGRLIGNVEHWRIVREVNVLKLQSPQLYT
jgi:hypothetical protein